MKKGIDKKSKGQESNDASETIVTSSRSLEGNQNESYKRINKTSNNRSQKYTENNKEKNNNNINNNREESDRKKNNKESNKTRVNILEPEDMNTYTSTVS
jgi:hypothetical protein